jgi:hypothetical protein
MILINAISGDEHADCVAEVLKQRGAAYTRCDFHPYPAKLQIGVSWQRSRGQSARLDMPGVSLDLSDVSAVWWNRAYFISRPGPATHKGLPAYIWGEGRDFLNGIHDLMPHALWVSSPPHAIRANNKIHQLAVASRLGFAIPDSCIGNNAAMVQALLDEHAHVALKTLFGPSVELELTFAQHVRKLIYHLKYRKLFRKHRLNTFLIHELRYKSTVSIWTRRLSAEDAAGMLEEKVAACPVIWQEYIPKQLELRITVVGTKLFPCAIFSQEAHPDQHVDWRKDPLAVRHEPYELPAEIAAKCLTLMAELGLQFGCIDLILTPSNEYVFLEINPFGQWLWVERLTGLPISAALADLLIAGVTGGLLPK